MPDFQIDKFFEESNKYIAESLSKDEAVLVVCTAGISRSASIVIAYLIKEKKMSYSLALAKVKEARMFVQPNVGFERTLKAYSDKHACELCTMEKKTHWFD